MDPPRPVCQGCFLKAAMWGIYCNECHYDIAGRSANVTPSALRNKPPPLIQRQQMRILEIVPDFSSVSNARRRSGWNTKDGNDAGVSWRRANLRNQPAINSFFYRNIFTGKLLPKENGGPTENRSHLYAHERSGATSAPTAKCSNVELWALTDGRAEVLTLSHGKVCPFRMCRQKFGIGTFDLSWHMRRRHGYEPCRATSCRLFFADVAERDAHERHQHGAHKNLACRVCGKGFSSAVARTSHVWIVHRCFSCDRNFAKNEMQGHQCRNCRRHIAATREATARKASRADKFFV
ncbi:Hypothetical predicted protein [Cloeon dipterum]|uniref:C2H2-type domain-containing protein n=1 Tax=Cloeon dipterum TaxID=197152 RepID=A0A8S1DBL6_9INSE|nr:Hypothetical predicted protein [Cloeon dipterum]